MWKYSFKTWERKPEAVRGGQGETHAQRREQRPSDRDGRKHGDPGGTQRRGRLRQVVRHTQKQALRSDGGRKRWQRRQGLRRRETGTKTRCTGREGRDGDRRGRKTGVGWHGTRRETETVRRGERQSWPAAEGDGGETEAGPCRLRGEARAGPSTRGCPRGPPTQADTHLHEVVDGLQVGQVVVVDVHADAEVEAGVASVNDLEVPELRAERP